jgi:SnoaL-like domain
VSATSDSSLGARLVAQMECEQLFVTFHSYIDDGSATRALDLFTEDGIFEARGQRHEGRAALEQFLQAREAATHRRTRHLASNFRFILDSPQLAHAAANLTLFTVGECGELELEAVVDCELRFVRSENSAWRISTRRHTRFASTGT